MYTEVIAVKTRSLAILLSVLLIAFSGFFLPSGVGSAEAVVRDDQAITATGSYQTRIRSLKEAMTEYDSARTNADRYAIHIRVTEMLEDILWRKESLTARPEDFDDSGARYYLRLSSVAQIGEMNYRVVEFGFKGVDMGTGTTVYVQGWDDGRVSSVEKLESIVQGPNPIRLLAAGISQAGGQYWAVILEKHFGPEYTSLRVITHKFDSGWQPFAGTPEPGEKAGWAIEPMKGASGFVLWNEKVTWNSGCDYDVRFSSAAVDVAMTSKTGAALDRVRLSLDKDGWILH